VPQEVTTSWSSVAAVPISLLSEPEPVRTVTSDGGWDLDRLDEVAASGLVGDLVNRFALLEHPDLRG
jgi:hypothetical protein